MDYLVASTVKRVVVFVYQGGLSVQKDTFRDFYEAREWLETGPDYVWSWMQMLVFFDDGSSETWFKLPRKGGENETI